MPSPREQWDWPDFVYGAVPQLEGEGWRIEVEDGFRHTVVDGGGEWDAELQQDEGWWFSLDLGIEVDGERVALLPVLTSLLARLRNLGKLREIDALARNGVVFGNLPDGRHVALPLERTKAILATLVELYDPATVAKAGKLGISAGELAGLAAVEAATQLRWLGGERLRALAERLSRFSRIDKVEPPAGLQTELRPYQREGLDWLQFLRAYELGGILADDMGLGKTVQALAHILVEKREGRLDRPCLVVCPTSVVPNWLAEAARLAPELRVLSLHGPDRAQRFGEIGNADLVITTYALLSRDADQLLPVAWHIAVLDEAQAIKNANAKTTQLACRLDARHRLCLTGTPLENHLGELWSQFAFLMPGLLGDARRFGRVFRTPIEKKQDEERRAVLSAAPEAVSAAPDEIPGGRRSAAEDRDLAAPRAGRAAARPLRDRAGRDAREGALRDRPQGARPQPHRRARRAPEAAPGVLRPAPRQALGGAPGDAPAPSSSI